MKQPPWITPFLVKAVQEWRSQGFVHGDLSPRNILIDFNHRALFFVDWVLDLESFEATPQYAAKEVYQKRRTWFSDYYAAAIICREEHPLRNINESNFTL